MFRFALIFLLMLGTRAAADPLTDHVRADLPSLVALYHDLHMHPEVSGEEVATSARLATEMRGLGSLEPDGLCQKIRTRVRDVVRRYSKSRPAIMTLISAAGEQPSFPQKASPAKGRRRR